ncbi:MAG TPA: accessory factor UbiK family protein [Steroidobacteraceae bacterium]|nr:accessory factor UbiK family protein [Steroidobacteraceae bacterium]
MASTGVEELAKRLFEGLPESARTLRHDIENNFRAILQSGLSRLELTTRTEFEVQTRVLERTRARLEQLEQQVAKLEQRLREFEEALPPVSD